MTDAAQYAALVDNIFGAGTATFDALKVRTNSVLGALAKATDFATFRANFEHRLRRLAAAIHADESLRQEILAAVNRIATSGWDGAYAELSALDFFLADPSTGPSQIVLDHTVPATQTLASELGMKNVNHDIRFPWLGVSVDTKLLSDKIEDILKGIFADFRKARNITHLSILPSYSQGEDFELFSSHRQALLSELEQGVDVTTRPRHLSSRVIPGLTYEFGWDAGVMFGASFYSPIEHAAKHHRLLFGHAKKFSKVEPTVLVLVIFPWSGETVHSFKDPDQTFFVEFGKQFFSGYVSSPEAAKTFNRKFVSSITAADVTRHLSGILFLRDDTILSPTPGAVNANASYVLNQNAIHPLIASAFEAVLKKRGAVDLSAKS